MRTKNYFSKESQNRFIQAYGHGQVYSYPDIPYLEWKYSYDVSVDFSKKFEETRIHNVDRYKRTFTKIKTHLKEFLNNNFEFKDNKMPEEIDIDKFWDMLFNRKIFKERIDDWQSF